jgi:hypothetical protein
MKVIQEYGSLVAVKTKQKMAAIRDCEGHLHFCPYYSIDLSEEKLYKGKLSLCSTN